MRVVDDHIDRLWKLREQATSFADIAAIEAAIAALSHAAGQEADKGPWKVGKDGRDLFSDDFTVDAALRISGDFHDDDHRMRYAEWLCGVLNSPAVARSEGEGTKRLAEDEVAVPYKLLDELQLISEGVLPDGDGVDVSTGLWAEGWLRRIASSGMGGG